MKKLKKPGEEITLAPAEIADEAASLTPGAKAIEDLVKSRHPEYERLATHWEFMKKTYEGGREWFVDNIFQYFKEGQDEFTKRQERAYRFNHTKEVVDLLNKYLFKQNTSRKEDAAKPLLRFWKRATKSGLSIEEFMREVSKQTSITGRVGIVVDKPAGNGAMSIAEAEKEDNQAYAYIVGPEALLDYSFDARGGLNWVMIAEKVRDDADPFNSSRQTRQRYRLWTKTSWYLIEKTPAGKHEVKESDQHDLGEVPVVLADHIISEEGYEAASLIDDVAYLDRAVANYLSNLDAIIQDQTFSQLAMPAQGIVPGEKTYEELLKVGTKRVFLYDGESGAKPEYLSPDPKQAELIISVVNKIINEIYHTVGLAGERTKEDNAVGIDNSSGVAKAFDFERVNALLASKGDSLETIENRLARLVCLWNGVSVTSWEDVVQYPDSYDVRNLYDEFDIAGKLALIQAPDTLRREQMRALADKMFPQLKDDLKKAIQAELDGWPLDPIEQLRLETEATTPPEAGDPSKSRQGQVTRKSPKAPNNKKTTASA